MKIKDRIKSLRRVKASELRPNPRNWRTHPQAQQDAMRGVLAEVGIADAVLARELEDGTLELIDGHLRADVMPDQKIPVLVLDVNADEANKILATHDPLASMAEADPVKLDELLSDITMSSSAVDNMLSGLGDSCGVVADGDIDNPEDEWDGMPEFEQDDQSGIKTLKVHFASVDDVAMFAKLINQKITRETISIWFPEQKAADLTAVACADES